MRDSKQRRLAIRIRLLGRVFGLVTAGFSLIFIVAEAFGEPANAYVAADKLAGFLLAILIVIAIAGCILSWWRERTAAVLLVLVAVGLGIHIGVYAGRNHLLAWSMVGLPYLIAGELLLYAWRLERKLVS
ncbi:MAG: hypothetical protein JSV74_04425 [Dehalococcoidia bacterium]|nr:MAG: hypothetical protein JSV74_04425 [Dehalococcoidia bacterium]